MPPVTAIHPEEPELANFSLNSPSPHILFDTVPPSPSQTGEGMSAKEEEWTEVFLIKINRRLKN